MLDYATYRAIFDHSPLPMWIFDRETLRYIAVNDAACKRYGYTLPEFLEMQVPDISISVNKERIGEGVGRVTDTTRHERPFTHRTKAGEQLEVQIVVHPLVVDGRPAMLSMLHDVTKQQQELTVRRDDERARLGDVAEASYDAIIGWSLPGEITIWNRAAENLLGYRAADVIGRLGWFLLPPDSSRHSEVFGRARQGDPVAEIELTLLHKDGQTVNVGVTLAPIHDSQGNIAGITSVIRDIEERRANERMRHQLFSILAHELKTPITTIKGVASGLKMEGLIEDRAERAEMLAAIVQESDRLKSLVDDLLDTAKIEAGAFQLDYEAWPLGELFTNIQKELQTLTACHNLDVQVPPDLPEVWADYEQVRRVVTNLAGNAAKFSETGSTVSIFATEHEGMIVIEVSDQGPGIAEEDLTSIFEPFYRGRRQAVARTPGSGLGLALCKGIVEAHGGSIGIPRNGPAGTTFAFTLPESDSGE